jgi:large repetitive protein
MLARPYRLQRNGNLKRSKAYRPRIEWMEPRTLLSTPTVTGMSPTTGPAVGGTLVTITGTSFTGATAVDFGLTAATDVTVVSNTTITADSPAGTGLVGVSVTTPAGTSAPSEAALFTYTAAAAPTVTGLSPASGPVTGGTFVTITGAGFTGATAVDFGPTAATGLIVVNDSTITADNPAGTGLVGVSVTTPAGTSAPSDAALFTYTAANEAPVITSAGSTTFAAGTSGTFRVTTTGVPTPALSETGALPSGVTFVDNGDGTATLAGAPATGTAGTYPLDITATNGVAPDANQSFTLTVAPALAPAITSAGSTAFTAGTLGTFTVTTTGVPNPALSETGALPSGVTFVDNGNGTATLSGTPADGTGATYALTITAANGGLPDATQSLALTVNQAPAIVSFSLADFTTGTAGTFTVETAGFPTSALSETGALPSGVTFLDNLNGTATIAGTPAAGTGGTYTLTITAANGVLPDAIQSFEVMVNQAPAFTSPDATAFVVGIARTFTVTTTGFTPATLLVSGALPSGVTFFNNGDGTATLSGTPAVGSAGTYPLTINAANGAGQVNQNFTLTVAAGQAPAITSASSTTFTAGTLGTFTVMTTGLPTPALSETGALPSGLTFVDNGNGTATLSGTPADGTGATYALTITAANGVLPDAVQSFTLTLGAAAAAPTVTGLSPTTGPAAGGTFVTITGSGFTGAKAVDFGTTAATSVTVVSATTITAESPAGTGTVNVTVITQGGTSAISAADQFTYAVAAPTVVSLARFGFHMQQTTLVLTFSSALDATPAEDVNNYQILATGGVVIPVSAAVYDPATLTVTLFPAHRLNLHVFYQLTVNGTTPSGLTGATGVPLDGLGNGTSGTNFVRTFSGGILAGPAPALLNATPKRFAAAQRELSADEKKWAAESKNLAAEQRKLAAAEKRLAARLRLIQRPSAVEALSALGNSTASPKAIRIHVGYLEAARSEPSKWTVTDIPSTDEHYTDGKPPG